MSKIEQDIMSQFHSLNRESRLALLDRLNRETEGDSGDTLTVDQANAIERRIDAIDAGQEPLIDSSQVRRDIDALGDGRT